MPTDNPWCFVIEPRRFTRMIEGQVRHYITDVAISEGDRIVFHNAGTQHKAVFLATFVDENEYEVHGVPYMVYTVAVKLQEWASPDTQ